MAVIYYAAMISHRGLIRIFLSSAEVARACDDAAKEAVLHNNTDLTQSIIIEAFERRKSGKQLFTS